MAQVPGVLARVANLLRSVGIKAPWKYTGPVSSPEYLSHLPAHTEYRAVAPGTPGIRALVPQAELDRVYDIKYYTRDSRRSHLPGGSVKLAKTEVDPRAPLLEGQAAVAPPTPGAPKRWGPFQSILDNDNNGYTL